MGWEGVLEGLKSRRREEGHLSKFLQHGSCGILIARDI